MPRKLAIPLTWICLSDRRDILSEALGALGGARCPGCPRFGQVGSVAQHGPPPFPDGKRGAGAFGDHAPLLLGQGCVDVQHERIDVGAEFGDHGGHPLRHQPGNEMHVAAQPVGLGDQHLPAMTTRGGQGRCELRPPVERIGPLPRLNLVERLDQVHAVLGGKLGAALPLGIQS